MVNRVTNHSRIELIQVVDRFIRKRVPNGYTPLKPQHAGSDVPVYSHFSACALRLIFISRLHTAFVTLPRTVARLECNIPPDAPLHSGLTHFDHPCQHTQQSIILISGSVFCAESATGNKQDILQNRYGDCSQIVCRTSYCI